MSMVTKKVLLQKQIENTLYSILPQTDATVVQYTKGSGQDAQVTTVAAELAALATAAASVITEQQVDTKISTAATNLYNQISGLADGESLAASFDTLKEISAYLDSHGSVVAGFSSDISADPLPQRIHIYRFPPWSLLHYDNVLVLNCFDTDHLDDYDEIKPFMNKLIKRIVEELGNPSYVDLQDARVDNHYYFNPYYRVLMFNVDYSNLDTLSSVIEKLKR